MISAQLCEFIRLDEDIGGQALGRCHWREGSDLGHWIGVDADLGQLVRVAVGELWRLLQGRLHVRQTAVFEEV